MPESFLNVACSATRFARRSAVARCATSAGPGSRRRRAGGRACRRPAWRGRAAGPSWFTLARRVSTPGSPVWTVSDPRRSARPSRTSTPEHVEGRCLTARLGRELGLSSSPPGPGGPSSGSPGSPPRTYRNPDERDDLRDTFRTLASGSPCPLLPTGRARRRPRRCAAPSSWAISSSKDDGSGPPPFLLAAGIAAGHGEARGRRRRPGSRC